MPTHDLNAINNYVLFIETFLDNFNHTQSEKKKNKTVL